MNNVQDKLITFWKLGLSNLIKVAFYRCQVKSGWFLKTLPTRVFQSLQWAKPTSKLSSVVLTLQGRRQDPGSRTLLDAEASAPLLTEDQYAYFFHLYQEIANPPDWFLNPFTRYSWKENQSQHWSRVRYFLSPGEDIKVIWELSRFYWMPFLAIQYRVHQNPQTLKKLYHWLSDWCLQNPINTGVNWLCAQEASIRLINFILSFWILGIEPGPAEIEFCQAHAKRISKTLYYADAQCNNHATSEAVGLYIVGTWLGDIYPDFRKYADLGRARLETLSQKLILSDGTFAQYSVTYHRMMLDSLSLALYFQRKKQDRAFSSRFMAQYQRAFLWLYQMVDRVSGDAPNSGSNDGTHFFKLDTCDYRDFRPSLQLASVLLNNTRLYTAGPWDDVLKVLELGSDVIGQGVQPSLHPKELPVGGYVFFREEAHWAMLKYPVYRYRPPQCDAMHFDLWAEGENILIDAGSYSYNAAPQEMQKFSGVRGHNTVQFDGHDQMPKLSRFLYGSWLKTKNRAPLSQTSGAQRWSGLYQDAWGAVHKRTVILRNADDVSENAFLTPSSPAEEGGGGGAAQYHLHPNPPPSRGRGSQYRIIDEISGFRKNAAIRWHSPFLDWTQTDKGFQRKNLALEMQINSRTIIPIQKMGEISRYYLEKEPCLVFELEVLGSPVIIETLITIQ